MTRTSAFALATTLALASLAYCDAPAAAAGGTQPRAFVSSNGSDVPGCASIITPCRTFQYAHDNIVAPGGSIYVVNAANYGQLVITHAISIINDGSGTATVLATSGDGVDINIPAGATGGNKVLIKGLTIDGVGTGTDGINVLGATNLTVVNCTVTGFAAVGGVSISPNADTATTNFWIVDTVIANNNFGVFVESIENNTLIGTLNNVSVFGSASNGIEASNEGTNGTITMTIENSVLSGNQNGVSLTGGTYVAKNVNASNNSNFGFFISIGTLTLDRSTAQGNGKGDVSISGGVFANSYGNNSIGSIVAGSFTPIHLQ